MLLVRSTSESQVQFCYPSGIRQGDDVIEISELSHLSLLTGVEEQSGKIYSAMLFHASDDQPHRYRRGVAQVTLGSTDAQAGSTATLGASKATHPAIFGLIDFPSRYGDDKAPDCTFSHSVAPVGSSTLEMDKGGAEEVAGDANDTAWPYLLLYAVKEGVLAYFSENKEECEEVVRAIARSYAPGAAAQGSDVPRGAGGTAAAASLAASLRVKCVDFPLGRALAPVARALCDMLKGDLVRRFQIKCTPEEQAECTNCAVFCLRTMLLYKLSVRKYDVEKLCHEQTDLGSPRGRKLAGVAVGTVLEQLVRRCRT